MNENKLKVNVTPESKAVEAADPLRRDFLKKYGKLAAITPVAMTMALHSKQALASGNSGQGGGGGTGSNDNDGNNGNNGNNNSGGNGNNNKGFL